MTTISFSIEDYSEAMLFSAMSTGYFIAKREYPTADTYLYLKTGDNKLYCLGRAGDAFRVPSELAEPARCKSFYGYRQVDLDIIVKHRS